MPALPLTAGWVAVVLHAPGPIQPYPCARPPPCSGHRPQDLLSVQPPVENREAIPLVSLADSISRLRLSESNVQSTRHGHEGSAQQQGPKGCVCCLLFGAQSLVSGPLSISLASKSSSCPTRPAGCTNISSGQWLFTPYDPEGQLACFAQTGVTPNSMGSHAVEDIAQNRFAIYRHTSAQTMKALISYLLTLVCSQWTSRPRRLRRMLAYMFVHSNDPNGCHDQGQTCSEDVLEGVETLGANPHSPLVRLRGAPEGAAWSGIRPRRSDARILSLFTAQLFFNIQN